MSGGSYWEEKGALAVEGGASTRARRGMVVYSGREDARNDATRKSDGYLYLMAHETDGGAWQGGIVPMYMLVRCCR